MRVDELVICLVGACTIDRRGVSTGIHLRGLCYCFVSLGKCRLDKSASEHCSCPHVVTRRHSINHDDGAGLMAALVISQLLVSVLRKRTWRHELQELDATDKVAAQGCELSASLHSCSSCCGVSPCSAPF